MFRGFEGICLGMEGFLNESASGISCNSDNNRSKRSYFKHDLYHLPGNLTTNTI